MIKTKRTQLQVLPALQDNYIWVLHNDSHAVVVDPGEAAPVQQWLQAQQRVLAAILITHHHWDHTNGIAELLRDQPATVVGPAHERSPIHGLQIALEDGQTYIQNELGLHWQALHVPGHTLGATALYCPDFDEDGVVLTGDTLFMAGCGRLFEGSAEQMYHSLQRLAALPGATRVCCGHEYSQANLRFAQAVEPGNPALSVQLSRVNQLRDAGKPSLPSTIAIERAVNPFLRCDEPEVIAAATRRAGQALHSPAAVFAVLREWKDDFRAP